MASIQRSAVVSILFTVFGGPGLILVYIPFWMTRFRIPANEPTWQRLVACALICAGLVPLLASIRRFIVVGHGTLVPAVPTQRLVVSGLYSYVRNPMYAGVLTALCGETMLLRTRGMAILTLVAWAMFHLFVLLYEEPTLARRYGEEFAAYRRNVPRWLPRITP